MVFFLRAGLLVLAWTTCSGHGHRIHKRQQIQRQSVEDHDPQSVRKADAPQAFAAFLLSLKPATAWQAVGAKPGQSRMNSLSSRQRSSPVSLSSKRSPPPSAQTPGSTAFAARAESEKRARLRFKQVGQFQSVRVRKQTPSRAGSADKQGPFAESSQRKRATARSRRSAKYQTVPEGGHRSAEDLYYAVYKPFGVLAQFEDGDGRPTLKSLGEFEKDVYPAGRLDMDSEGLLVLTNDGVFNQRILDPKYGHWRTYWVQVEGEVTPQAIAKLRKGVDIRPRKHSHRTLPAKAQIIDEPTQIPERDPPIRQRENIPTSWVELSIMEGKYRQVRKMLAAVGFPVLRLIRVAVENLKIDDWKVGGVSQYTRDEIYDLISVDVDGLPAEEPLALAY